MRLRWRCVRPRHRPGSSFPAQGRYPAATCCCAGPSFNCATHLPPRGPALGSSKPGRPWPPRPGSKGHSETSGGALTGDNSLSPSSRAHDDFELYGKGVRARVAGLLAESFPQLPAGVLGQLWSVRHSRRAGQASPPQEGCHGLSGVGVSGPHTVFLHQTRNPRGGSRQRRLRASVPLLATPWASTGK